MRRHIMRGAAASMLVLALAGCASSEPVEDETNYGRTGPGGGSANVSAGGDVGADGGTGTGTGGGEGTGTGEPPTGEEGDTGTPGDLIKPEDYEGFNSKDTEAPTGGNQTADPDDIGILPQPGEVGSETAPALTPIPTAEQGGLPYDKTPAQDGSTWVVYTVTGSVDGPEVYENLTFVSSKGHAAHLGAVSCDTGAAEKFGLSPDDARVAVYFASENDANLYSQRYGGPVVGVAQVTATCMA